MTEVTSSTPMIVCLFCTKTDGGYTSREHVFPESMGNRQVIIEPGVICDRCNHGPLSQLDQALLDFYPVSMLRTMSGIASKRGKVPTTRAQTGTIGSPSPGLVIFDNASDRKPLIWETGRIDGEIHLRSETSGGKRLTPRYVSTLSRAILKIAFECAWMEEGARLLDNEFDGVRAGVLGAPYDGFLAIEKRAGPAENVTSTSQFVDVDGQTLMGAGLNIYGLRMFTGMVRPPADLPGCDVISFGRDDMSVKQV